MGIEALTLPKIAVRGRSFMALALKPEPPLRAWLAALDQHIARSTGFFAGRPVIVDLAEMPKAGTAAAGEALDALEARGLRPVGVEGIDSALLAGGRWERLPALPQGQDRAIATPDDRGPEPQGAAPAPSLLVDRPVRSGQQVLFEDGDVTVIGSVASGAEVIAGGSIHIYGALRGRAIAGIREGGEARIFCRRLEAELVAVDQLYRTAEHWGEGLHGRPVQIRRDRGSLRLQPLG
jgi:septum site-determining protein MinC